MSYRPATQPLTDALAEAGTDISGPAPDSTEWQAGETHHIPRIHGRGYDCTIISVSREYVRFHGPWGAGMISHRLLKILTVRTHTNVCKAGQPQTTELAN